MIDRRDLGANSVRCSAIGWIVALCIGWLTAPVLQAGQQVPTPGPYAPLAFLVGEWDVGPIGGKVAAITRFHWGSARTYLWYSGALLTPSGEQPMYEGLIVWNGVRKNFDYLLVLEPSSENLVQEQGTIRVEPDGTVVREITVFYSEGNAVPPNWDRAAGPEGACAQFRQTFTPDSPDRVLTKVMHKTEDGWVPSFPGSDRLVMVRRPESKD